METIKKSYDYKYKLKDVRKPSLSESVDGFYSCHINIFEGQDQALVIKSPEIYLSVICKLNNFKDFYKCMSLLIMIYSLMASVD